MHAGELRHDEDVSGGGAVQGAHHAALPLRELAGVFLSQDSSSRIEAPGMEFALTLQANARYPRIMISSKISGESRSLKSAQSCEQ